MKSFIGFYSLLLLIVVAGCKKDVNLQPDNDGMFISAYKNNDGLWISNEPYGSLSKIDKTMWVGGYKILGNTNGNSAESLIIQLEIADLSNLKNIILKNVQFTTLFGGDIIADRYTIDTTNDNNMIEITEIDETKKIMKGKFSLHLVRDQWFSANGEEATFKEGEFVTDYIEN